MTFLEILKSKATDLPLVYSGSFRDFIRKKIIDFGDIIDNSSDLSDDINGLRFRPDTFKKRSKILRDAILKTLDIYYEGNPGLASIHLEKSFKEMNLIGYLSRIKDLKEETNFFRLRINNQNYPFSKEELFHIPFEKRTKVNTQRYSIPGLPSLYMSNSIYVAWEELKRPDFSQIHACRIVNSKSISLLDLTTDIFSKNDYLTDNHAYGWNLLYKVMIWPVIAACSVKVQYPHDPFKPEYIIPQLLLQWVSRDDSIYGIKYSSTHVDLCSHNHEGAFYNIVLPVRTFNKEKGHCSQLLKIFKSTDVLPFQIRQLLTISDRFYNQESITTDVNPEINSIELVKNLVQPYSSTAFGVIEHNLASLETAKFK